LARAIGEAGMTESQIRDAHAALVEREQNWIYLINNWGRNEKDSEILIWPALEIGESATLIA
jgi:hypothetical protein